MIKTLKTIHCLIVVLLFTAGRSDGTLDYIIIQNNDFFNFEQTDRSLDPNHLNVKLLERALIYFTNEARKEHSLEACRFDTNLQKAARAHSEEMVRLEYFSHGSPVSENRRLVDRIQKAGVILGNTIVGENIGVDYLLGIANVPYYVQYEQGRIVYISGDTGEPIGYQTYREFANKMVLNWMNSPGHRENILNKKFHRIGIGISLGKFKGFESIYVTQNFLGLFKAQK